MHTDLNIYIFLDVLVLIMNIRDEETMVIVDQLIEVYTEELRLNKTINGALVQRFLHLLKSLRALPPGEDGNTARMAMIGDFVCGSKDVESEDKLFYDAMANIFEAAKDAKADVKLIKDKKRKIKLILASNRCKRLINRMFGKINEGRDTEDLDRKEECLSTTVALATDIINYIKKDSSIFSSSAEEQVVFSSETSLRAALQKAIDSESVTGVLKSDLQGFNQMCGPW